MPHTKQEKPFSEKLKAFFRVGKSSGFPHPGSCELVLTPEVVEELSITQPVSTRLKTLKDLGGQVKEQRLQQHGVELLWYKIQDLLESNQDNETRHTVFEFLVVLVSGQYNSLDMMRPQLFMFIKEHKIQEDITQKMSLLVALTENGKDIVHIEEQVGPFILELLETVKENDSEGCLVVAQLLSLTSNMVKFNSAYLSQAVVIRFIIRLAQISCNSSSDKEILQCLDILKCVVMYSYVPPEALVHFVSCVCRVVNLSNVSSDAWDTMKKMMGTHLGHSALYQLCQIIQNPDNREETALVRGAVFFIGHSLWGAQKIQSLKYSPMTVLPVFCTALDTPHQLVLYEVVVQVERLVTKHQETITAPSWEEAVSVLELLVTRLGILDDDMKQLVHDHLQATIGQLEQLAMTDHYAGSRSRLYSLVESVSQISPEASVIHLVNYQHSTYLHPARAGWLDKMSSLVDKLFCQEKRQGVRLKVLGVLKEVVTSNMVLWEEQLMERCVLPYLSSIDGEADRVVRLMGVQILAVFATKAMGSHLLDLVEILEKIVKKFGDSPSVDTAILYTKQDFDYQFEAVRGLVKCMKVKFLTGPGSVARRCYYGLVTLLDNIYERPAVLEHTGEMRVEIFQTFLSIRANRDYHLGIPKEGGRGKDYTFSPYVVCQHKEEGKVEGVTQMSLTRACLCILKCLKEEKDWKVLGYVLEKLPMSLQNKGLITRYGKDISKFAAVLCSLFSQNHPIPSMNTPPKFGRPELQSVMYPVLAAIASYNRSLDQEMQKRLIRCFEYGLITSKCNQVCIVALTACILEMSGSMYTLIPEVLLNLSKISATVHIAIPVLEFLSTLISLPKVFASFNTEQFLSVFAITLPYTNPFKFNHYTVSLAHHVIIMWFLKCRLSQRKDFVKFIIKGLNSNVLQPFEEGNFRKVDSGTSLASLNQDSSNRKRSSSLKEETTSRRVRHNTGVPSRPTVNRLSGPDERQALLTFHQELTETCVDLMARYSFANCGVAPKRGPVSEYLTSQGQSSSWVLGNVIITITVSGCAQSGNRGGFCDSCFAYCKQEKGVEGDVEEAGKSRARHQSEQSQRVRRELVGGEVDVVQPLIKDDSHVGWLKEDMRKDTGGRKRGQLPDIPASASGCGCWCTGWCEVMVRRPSGVTSWMARVQNGLLSNQPCQETDLILSDITAMIRPDLASDAAVQRSNSSPSIGEDGGTRLELDLAGGSGGRRMQCGTIAETEEDAGDLSPAPVPRARAATISTSPSKLSRPSTLPPASSERGGGVAISPQFLFLQLYQAAGIPTNYSEKPLLLPNTKSIESSLRNLDRIFCYETHKVGVLYVGPGQHNDEKAILSNQYGSVRYSAFLSGLGTLLDITTTDPNQVFLGGLDPRDDGQFHYVWQDDAMQVVYHAATLMPSTESDTQFNKKKRHIGNDYVAIVYNDSGDSYTMGTVKGQFIYAHIVVEPLDFGSNRISVVCKQELEGQLGHLSTSRIVSDPNLSRVVRQIALHCNLAAIIFSKSKLAKVDPYASNWLERLRHIKRFKGKVLKDQQEEETSGQIHDFTGYV